MAAGMRNPHEGNGTSVGEVSLVINPGRFAMSSPFPIGNHYKPGPVPLRTDPADADVVAAPLPMGGGMRIVVYNRETLPVRVWFCLPFSDEDALTKDGPLPQ